MENIVRKLLVMSQVYFLNVETNVLTIIYKKYLF